jgi:nucleoside-diphosphate-sugar epimerase
MPKEIGDKEVILISGVSSFVGANLAIHFSNKGHSVYGLISQNLLSYGGVRQLRLDRVVSSGVKLETLDITDPDKLGRLIRGIKPSICFQHAAWTEHANSSNFDIQRAMLVNVVSLEPIYKELKGCGAKGVIITGSNAEYGDNEDACLENDICIPTTPYGLSKLVATLRSCQLAEQFNLPTRVARVYNPIGELDNPKKLLPTVIESLKQNKAVDLSPCDQKRDFIFIKDLLNGFQLLLNDLNRKATFEIFNLCSGEAISIKEILINVADVMGKNKSLLNFGVHPMRDGEPQISFGSNKKASELLGWNPASINEKLEIIVNGIINEKTLRDS